MRPMNELVEKLAWNSPSVLRANFLMRPMNELVEKLAWNSPSVLRAARLPTRMIFALSP